MRFKSFLACISSLSLSLFASVENDRYQEILNENFLNCGAIGASVAIWDQGQISTYNFGKKSIVHEDMISNDTIFEIGSISKVFTTLLLMDMVKKEQIDLDDSISKYFPNISVPEYHGKKITLRHLATHTSGLPRIQTDLEVDNLENPYKNYTLDSLLKFLASYELERAPGASFEYSNIGMGLLGHILEIRSKKSYEELVRELISQPLGMTSTAISHDTGMKALYAKGHNLGRQVSDWDIPALPGAGALHSNVIDLTKFLSASLDENMPLHLLLKDCQKLQFQVEPNFSIGLGWLLLKSNQSTIIYHNGMTGGFKSYLGFNPAINRGIVILSNSTEDWLEETALTVLDPNYEKPAINQELISDAAFMEQFIGNYVIPAQNNSGEQELKIIKNGKFLSFVIAETLLGMIYPESESIFGMKGFQEGKVHFVFDKNFKISKIEVRLIKDNSIVLEAFYKNPELN